MKLLYKRKRKIDKIAYDCRRVEHERKGSEIRCIDRIAQIM
jgi:hypothetical protein